ncbi:MAG: ATP-binding protein, partial [Halothiobacillus sp.]|nr:ATP-binding protein [Halothiobacillus sp.]
SRIFEPFYTTKKIGEGTGLGLSISYRIIKDHGGDIRLATKPGVGTRFEISLPIKPPTNQPVHTDSSSDASGKQVADSVEVLQTQNTY